MKHGSLGIDSLFMLQVADTIRVQLLVSPLRVRPRIREAVLLQYDLLDCNTHLSRAGVGPDPADPGAQSGEGDALDVAGF
jgi:hypothetical protein